jgi:glycosyltransferase involved in cell wall biosynthesis
MTNSKGPLVSVVFTSYNHIEYLEQALKSILDQTYSNFELIIVDDCSSDGSQNILRQYAPRFPQIKLHLLSKNTGSYVTASNYGANLALGDFLLFAQCDDFSEITQLEKLVKAFEDHPEAGVVYSRSNLVDQSGKAYLDDYVIRQNSFRKKCASNTIISGEEMRGFLSFSCVIPNLSAALIKKNLYVRSGGLSEKYLMAADWAFWLELSERTNFYYLTEPLNNFRQHQTTIRSTTKIVKQIEEIYAVFYTHIGKYQTSIGNKFQVKVNVGGIWFAYFKDNLKASIFSFPAAFLATFKYEKLNLFYFGLGACVQVRELFYRVANKH